MAKLIEFPKKYNIPKNWKWVELGEYIYTKTGYPFDSKKFTKKSAGLNGLIRIRDIVRGYTETYTDEDCPNDYIIHEGDMLIGMDGDFNIAKWKSSDAFLNQRVCLIKSNSKHLLNDYLFYYLPYPLKVINATTPSMTVKHLSAKTLEKIPFPLPPLAEQERIVNKLDNYISKLDEAKEKLEKVVDTYEFRKYVILNKAFKGELTKNWRKENNISFDNWQNLPISNLCNSLKYGTSKKSQKSGKVVVLRMGNIQNGEIDWNDLQFTDDLEDIKKYSLNKGDVLFNRTNSSELVGKTAIYRGEYPAIYAGYLIKLDYKKDLIIGDYLNYILNSIKAKYYCKCVKTEGVNQANINARRIGAFIIPLPPLEEQKEIVKILDSLLSKEKQVKEIAEKEIERVDDLKKNLLTRAFGGLLGTNDPNEENSIELLKTVL